MEEDFFEYADRQMHPNPDEFEDDREECPVCEGSGAHCDNPDCVHRCEHCHGLGFTNPDIDDHFDEDGEFEMSNFAHPGGDSALRAATLRNPRIYPCPTCNRKNMLTPADIAQHYQCDYCANKAERGC